MEYCVVWNLYLSVKYKETRDSLEKTASSDKE